MKVSRCSSHKHNLWPYQCMDFHDNFAYFWPTSDVVFAHSISSKIEFRPMGQHPFISGPVRKDHVWPKTVRKVKACSYLFHLVTIPLQIGYHQHTMALRP